MIVTGTAQRDAWQQRVLPPVELVRPGLWSIPVPIPDNPLRYTLAYAFESRDDGVLLVDPGWDSPEGRAALTAGLRDLGPVTGIVLTHVHPDHHGLSGWLRERSGAWIGMHPAEAAWLPARRWRDQPPGFSERWLRRHGAPEDLRLTQDRLDSLYAMAEPDRAIDDGDRLPLAGREVRAVWTPGHTPGHLCLHDAEAGVLLTGDHLLPRISPNIAVHPGDDGDPLTDYLGSLDRTAKFTGDEALPAHEYRFRGIGTRAAGLRRHHDKRSDEIMGVIATHGDPTSWQIAAALTWSRGWDALHGLMRRMALAETVAHLHHLAAAGAVRPTGREPIKWRG
ncbi:MBL fold metallo-hydrolase [Actinoplanes bogorensis]|uniref:MBL fold metallo-hydrolase n=1 Tax=Paractinoplanes bogorensis TaxID=1610840 RepID=A0ABS5YRX3_9ACTN|nr:MBL fold metallo-hydrolase [Actinoplanes bogorensis]MBU2666191.1 MBL fold metallo-hydrolase [Actinoplanes bogorensis]